MGTPAFGLPCLEALIKSQHEVLAVFCQPDRRQGRGQQTMACPIKACALANQITVHQPKHLKDETYLPLLAKADILVVIAYGLILPKAVLKAPKIGCINVHASLLPRWRGAAPIQRAIEAGDATTGITLMLMDEGLDTGPMLLQSSCRITLDDTSVTLSQKLANLAVTPLLHWLAAPDVAAAQIQPSTNVSYAKKLLKSEAEIDWQTPANALCRKLRAFQPWPGLCFVWQSEKIRIYDASCLDQTHSSTTAIPGSIIEASPERLLVATSENILDIQVLQLPNKKPCRWPAFYRGHMQLFQTGDQLT